MLLNQAVNQSGRALRAGLVLFPQIQGKERIYAHHLLLLADCFQDVKYVLLASLQHP